MVVVGKTESRKRKAEEQFLCAKRKALLLASGSVDAT